MTDIVPYTELIAVPDTYASGLAEAEDMGDGNFRLTFFARKKSLGYSMAENEIVDRLILPTSAIVAMVRCIMQTSGVQCCGGERLKHLAH